MGNQTQSTNQIKSIKKMKCFKKSIKRNTASMRLYQDQANQNIGFSQGDYADDDFFPEQLKVRSTYKMSKENLSEDIVETKNSNQDVNKAKNGQTKYQDLDLSELLTMKVQLGQEKVQLSSEDKVLPVMVTIEENKLDEIEEKRKMEKIAKDLEKNENKDKIMTE